ncbi:MAG: Mrp/NBP35 family ATP-binding protein, partial [Dehalococcoidia bacterium]
MVEQAAVLTALKTVNDPELHRDIVSLNMVRNLSIEGDRVAMELILTTPACPLRETIDTDVRKALAPLGVNEIDIDWGAEVRSTMREGGPKPIAGVRNVIAIASNKGGVGKSTVAVNLAVTLSKLGASVGLLDADITGPNIPTMLGIEGGLLSSGEQGLKAIEAHGIKAVSLGFVLPPGTPVVWRGPMIGSGVRQLMHDVDWGDLDYLIVDLPPGTSDASMTMAQEALIAGAVVVSTPSKVSVEDASKAVSMFDRLGVPIFGVIENMSSDIFGRGGAREAAEALGVEFLGEIPLSAAVRRGGDEGRPVVIAEPESEQTQAFI